MQKFKDWLIDNLKQRNAIGFIIEENNSLSYSLLKKICEETNYPTLIWDEEDIIEAADNKNLLIVSQLCKIDLQILRPWGRIGPIADLLPFGNYLKSELGLEINEEERNLEWLYNINKDGIYKGILDLDNPANCTNWFALSIKQKELIARINYKKRSTDWKTIKFNVYNNNI